MPSIEIGLIKSDANTIKNFENEVFKDVFENITDRFPQVIPENLYKYFKFYTKILVKSAEDVNKVYR
jgi:hypothetical protein